MQAMVVSALSNKRPGLPERLTASAAIVGNEAVDVADLVLLGLLRGPWIEFQASVNRGLALESLQLAALSGDELQAAARRFRYEHRLISARELTAWLEARSLSAADLSGVIKRHLLRTREADRPVDGAPLDASDVLWAEAVCGGVLRMLARAAADLLASSYRLDGRALIPADPARVQSTLELAREHRGTGLVELGEPDLRARLKRLLNFERALEDLREEVADEEAISRCVASHPLDWLQVAGRELKFENEGAAREARLLIVDDDLSLGEVAERVETSIHSRRMMLGAVSVDAAAALVACIPGEVAGPWREADGWRLLLVDSKRRPSAGDPELRQLAKQELLRGVLDQTLAGRASWPQAL